MKKILILLFIALVSIGCANNKQNITGDKITVQELQRLENQFSPNTSTEGGNEYTIKEDGKDKTYFLYFITQKNKKYQYYLSEVSKEADIMSTKVKPQDVYLVKCEGTKDDMSDLICKKQKNSDDKGAQYLLSDFKFE